MHSDDFELQYNRIVDFFTMESESSDELEQHMKMNRMD